MICRPNRMQLGLSNKSTMGWEGHVTRKEGGRNTYKFWTGLWEATT